MTRKNMIWAGLGAALLLFVAVGASAYVTKEVLDDPKPVAAKQGQKIVWDEPRPAPQPQKVASNCDDGNIVGTVVGGVGGGIIGNQIGSGSGNTVATIGGAVGGAALGNRYIPTRNVTCAQ